jgi:hypothetical protein
LLPGAALSSLALSAYLAVLLGIAVPPSVLAQWLVLVPVFALELGAALSVMLVEAVGPKVEAPIAETVPLTVSVPETVSTALLPAPGDHQLLDAPARAGRPLRNDELARAMGVSPGEASKRRKAVERLLNVERRGRTVLVSLARH